MSTPLCPACGAEPADPPAPCPSCGHVPAPPADEPLVAIPVRPPAPRRRRRPAAPLITEAQAATGVRWAIILYGLMVVGSCLLLGLLGKP